MTESRTNQMIFREDVGTKLQHILLRGVVAGLSKELQEKIKAEVENVKASAKRLGDPMGKMVLAIAICEMNEENKNH